MNLIIQGTDIQNNDLRAIAKLAQASQIDRITGEAFRMINAQLHPDIPDYCEETNLDHAFVPAGKKLSDFGLISMDMDSTLLAIESIDEIADMHNVKPQVSAITQSTMRGEISFAESLIRRTALLEGLPQEALQKVYDERVRLSLGAEKMLQRMQSAGIKTMVISGGYTFFTDRVKDRLGLDYAFANTFEVQDGKLTGRVLGNIIGSSGKGEILKRIRDELGLRKDQVIAVGDGANDLKMLEESGVGIAFHAKPVLKEKATFSLNHVGLDGILNLFE
ncbi:MULTISPECIES: phosphoserine phosphatase SerB [Nitrosomonas]|uniref:Phosphoserine phosphatase n=2 Tax=Nitrosomonas eutropha TaxID=916 RepID=A0ABX5M7S5_9PROT|nr:MULTISPECIES: phosphoserine phosphatase SerB [Nitrosomonas]ABI58869.1 phosphoserine phosphatase [Nitrosomonas eutropha C91]MXS79763.1 phosphoserine phosphatase SerB [Nitrosomonas sp. GH22]PXV80549.1 phosphoserine phosphatase [Nitrosomonas eutropha]SCX04675.1 phosphoserine phosphatase [Nitrosomonas eutropha]SDW46177.1 phosphoserine phosphatase [Nitrosomonas eutropha]